jgi:hypothetical protein
MIFELDGGQPIHLKECFIAEPLFILGDRQPIPSVTIMHDIIIGMKSKMGKDSLSKMNCPFQKVLRKILRDACHPRAFHGILRREQAIIRRKKVNVKLAIDEPADVMQNMR